MIYTQHTHSLLMNTVAYSMIKDFKFIIQKDKQTPEKKYLHFYASTFLYLTVVNTCFIFIAIKILEEIMQKHLPYPIFDLDVAGSLGIFMSALQATFHTANHIRDIGK